MSWTTFLSTMLAALLACAMLGCEAGRLTYKDASYEWARFAVDRKLEGVKIEHDDEKGLVSAELGVSNSEVRLEMLETINAILNAAP